MSLLIKNNNNKKSLSSLSTIATTRKTKPTFAASALAVSLPKRLKEADTIILHKNPTIKPTSTTTTRTRNSKSSLLTSSSAAAATTLLSPSVEEATLNVDAVSSSHISTASLTAISLMEQQQPSSSEVLESVAGRKVFRTMPSFKIMSYQNFIALLTVLVCGLVTVNGLKCYMCGQYNEGVGSITPCLNYSEQYAHLYLKECSKKSEKYCVKYVSELSIVRDCATECAEKEIWETQTYCCTEDGCNGSSTIEASAVVVMLPLVMYIVNEILNIMKQQSRR